MECIPINGLVFDQQSIDAIEDIKRRNDLFIILSKVMTYGTFFTIFAGKGSKGSGLMTAHNIKQSDFEMLAKALKGMPLIQRKIIQDIALRQVILHMSKHKERMFWTGIAEGCSVE